MHRLCKVFMEAKIDAPTLGCRRHLFVFFVDLPGPRGFDD